MPDPSEATVRPKIQEKLKAGQLLKVLPAGGETIILGAGAGKRCDGCDELITGDQAPSAQEFKYPNRVIRFHGVCGKVWDDERHSPTRR